MKIFKKLFTIIIVFIMCMGLISCSNSKGTTSNENTEVDVTMTNYKLWKTVPTEASASDYDFTNSFDGSDFIPNMDAYILDDQSNVKGNIIILSGGGDKTRSNDSEGLPAVEFFNNANYNAFLVNYRVSPYATVDATLDVGRAIRYVKANASDLGIKKIENIGLIGFSAGAMHCYSIGIAFGGDYTPDEIYSNYICDEIDNQSADVNTIMCIYAAGMTHDALGTAVDVTEPVLVPSENDPHYNTTLPSFFFAGASKHFASGFCIDGYEALNDLTECEIHMYGGISRPFGMGYDFVGSNQMTEQIEAWLNVQFGYSVRELETN